MILSQSHCAGNQGGINHLHAVPSHSSPSGTGPDATGSCWLCSVAWAFLDPAGSRSAPAKFDHSLASEFPQNPAHPLVTHTRTLRFNVRCPKRSELALDSISNALGFGLPQPLEALHGGRLAGAVSTKQSEDLPLGDVKGDVVYRNGRSVSLSKIVNFDDRLHTDTPVGLARFKKPLSMLYRGAQYVGCKWLWATEGIEFARAA